MVHQNFQEAIEQLSKNEEMSSEGIKSKFDLNEEEMKAMNSNNTLIQGATQPTAGSCCCCC